MFGRIDEHRFRQLIRHIQEEVCAVRREYETALPFEASPTIDGLLASVLPQDDSAGLDQTLQELFERQVEMYAASAVSPHLD